MSDELVLVTGGSGFIGAHCILYLLAAGYRVRTTVRTLAREADVRAMLRVGGADLESADLESADLESGNLSAPNGGERLSFVTADLNTDAGWAEAVADCTFVLHVASPFPLSAPKDEGELILPAREGTLRVLRAARDSGVQRVVLTSSSAAVTYGHKPQTAPFDETSWTEPDAGRARVTPYAKSKTLAERAAWDFVAKEGGRLQLSVVNPVGVFGPVLGPDYSSSIVFVRRMLDGDVPGLPRLTFGVVDVRDVADLHLRAMTNPAANGERFLAVAGNYMSVREFAAILRDGMGPLGKRVPSRQLPDWFMRLFAKFDKDVALILPELGKTLNATSAKAQRVLGWTPRTAKEAILATAESLARLGLLKNSPKSSH